MITKTQASEIRERYDKLTTWVDSIRNKRTGHASYKPEDKPASVPDVSNDERSALEVFDFVNDPPDKYFLYINKEKHVATTWTGDKLGNVRFGREYRDNFGGTRIPISVYGINGMNYHGTYFKSSGDYARIKRMRKKEANKP